MDIKIVMATTGLAMVALATSAAALSATETQINRQVSKTVIYFDTISSANKPLMDKAAGVLVFPELPKAASVSAASLAKARCRSTARRSATTA